MRILIVPTATLRTFSITPKHQREMNVLKEYPAALIVVYNSDQSDNRVAIETDINSRYNIFNTKER